MEQAGLNIKAIQGKNRLECKRSDKLLLVKNISEAVTLSELKEMFSRYGVIEKCMLSPSGTLGVVEYKSAD